MALVGNLTIGIGAATQGLQRDLKKASGSIGKFVSKNKRKMVGFGKILGGIGAAAFAGLAAGVAKLNQDLTELGRLSRRLGDSFSIQELDAFGKLARRVGGDVEDFTDAIEDLQVRIQEAVDDPSSDIAKRFEEIGLSAQRLSQQLPKDAFFAYAEAIRNVTDSQRALFVNDELLSDVGKRLNSLMRDQNKTLGEQVKELAEASTMTQDAVDKNDALNASMIRVSESMAKFSNTVGPVVIQFLNEAILSLEDAAKRMGIVADESSNGSDSALQFAAAFQVFVDVIGVAITAVDTLIRSIQELTALSFQANAPAMRLLGLGDLATFTEQFAELSASQNDAAQQRLTSFWNNLVFNTGRRSNQDQAGEQANRALEQIVENTNPDNQLQPAYIPK